MIEKTPFGVFFHKWSDCLSLKLILAGSESAFKQFKINNYVIVVGIEFK